MRTTKSANSLLLDLSENECHTINGGGFAYDAGYFLRILSGSYGPMAGYWASSEIAAYLAMN